MASITGAGRGQIISAFVAGEQLGHGGVDVVVLGHVVYVAPGVEDELGVGVEVDGGDDGVAVIGLRGVELHHHLVLRLGARRRAAVGIRARVRARAVVVVAPLVGGVG